MWQGEQNEWLSSAFCMLMHTDVSHSIVMQTERWRALISARVQRLVSLSEIDGRGFDLG